MRFVALLVLLCAAANCVPQYRPPTAEQPHSIVKFRRSYVFSAGTSLGEQLTVDGHEAYARTSPAGSAQVPQTDGFLIHPRAASLIARSTFFHMETRAVQESYSEQVPYSATESYSCGTGTSYRTCTRMVTRYHSQTRYRTVMRSVRVTDAECTGASWIAPAPSEVYLLEFNYQGPGVCRLSCFHQIGIGSPNLSFEMEPCPTPPAETH